MGQNNHSGHWDINPPQKHHPLFLAKPLSLNQETFQASPLFRQSFPIYWFFKIALLKFGPFSEPEKY